MWIKSDYFIRLTVTCCNICVDALVQARHRNHYVLTWWTPYKNNTRWFCLIYWYCSGWWDNVAHYCAKNCNWIAQVVCNQRCTTYVEKVAHYCACILYWHINVPLWCKKVYGKNPHFLMDKFVWKIESYIPVWRDICRKIPHFLRECTFSDHATCCHFKTWVFKL